MKRDDFADEDLADIILGPDDEPPNKSKKERPQARRLPRSREFTRLWLVVWYRSGEGEEPIKLTQKVAEEASIPRRLCHRYARQLEKLALIQVERRGKSALILTVRVRPPPVAP